MTTEHQNLTQAIRNNGRISAIKALRAIMSESGSHAGLIETKRIVDAIFDAVQCVASDHVIANPACTADPNPQDAHYVVATSYTDETVVSDFKGSDYNFDDAMNYAQSKTDNGYDVRVARVVATTKRTLRTV